jgi:hypothetical protein
VLSPESIPIWRKRSLCSLENTHSIIFIISDLQEKVNSFFVISVPFL